MNNSFLAYLEQLELMLFFAGYPLIYLLIRAIGETGPAKSAFKINIAFLLPYAYGLTGVFYLALQLKNLYPEYSLEHTRFATQIPLLKIWGLLSILFLIPFFAKKIVYSLLHSLIFFFFIVKDLWLKAFHLTGETILKNDMNIYTCSLLINLAAISLVIVFYFLRRLIKRALVNRES